MNSRTLSSLVLAAALLPLVPVVQPAGAQEIAAGALTVSGDFAADFVADRGHVTVLRLSGSYDRTLPGGGSNVEPRSLLAQEFYKHHPDSYDFLVAFTTFPVVLEEARGLHWSVRNDVQGIGLPQFDNSAAFGSDGRLQGFVDMGRLAGHASDTFDPGFERTLTVLTHEILHQWAAYVRFRRPDGSLSDALIGRDGSHWSFLLDTDASVLYGNEWRDNGDGTFTTDGDLKFYSPLDLYLAGFLAAGEVPPFLLIESAGFDRNRLPERGVTVTGTALQVTIEDVIAAEGPRVPAAAEAQREFRTAFLLVTRPGEVVTPAQVEALDRIRRALVTRFAALTGGRGILHVYPEAIPGEEPGAPDPVDGGAPRPGQANLTDALAWLRSRQGADGSWLDTAGTQPRDSAAVLATLAAFDPAFVAADRARAVAFLAAQTPPNTDAVARLANALEAVAESDPAVAVQARTAAETLRARLRERQNADGGWGLGTGYGSDPLDTALAVLALSGRPGTPAAVLDRAGQYLLAARGADGGWSNVARGASRSGATVAVLRALKALDRHAAVADDAMTFLAGRQNPDGGFGDSPSTAHDTANVLQTAVELSLADRIDLTAALGYLSSRQTVAGSWEGSTYTTATVVTALSRQGTFPNWRFSAPPAASPARPRDGERVALTLTVGNDGQAVTPAGVLRLYDGDPASGGTPAGDFQLPPIAPGRTVVVSATWDSFGKPGERTLWAVIDPDGATAEMSELDNRASIRVEVQPAPAGVELEVRGVDVAILPARPATLPVQLGIAVSVRNLGQTDAAEVAVQLWRGPPATGELAGEATIPVPGRSSNVASFLYDLTTAGTTTFTVVVDPGGAIAEEDETNNTATASVTTQAAVDLEVTGADLRLTGSAFLGTDATFEATFRNRGTVDSPDAVVRFSVTQGATVRELGTRTLQLDAGQSFTQSVTWRVDLEGELQFVAEIDPGAQVPESDEANNSAALPFTSGQISEPNLVVSHQDLAFTPDPGREGRPLTVTALVRNTGGQPVASVEVAFYEGNPAQGASRIGDVQVIPELAAGGSATVSVTLARFPDPNDRVVHVVVDPDGEVAEYSEDDNVAFEILEVLSLPDAALSAASLRLEPGVPVIGQPVTLVVTVANLGEQEIESLVVRAFDGGAPVGGDQVIALMPGRGSAQASFTWTFAAGTPGDGARPIVATADPDAAVEEQSEANNTASVEVSVQDGDFFVTNRYFSPNGDGVKDTTRFFFRLGAPADVTVEVMSPRGEVVRRQDLAGVDSGSFEWDGRDDQGRVVADGTYTLRASGAGGSGQAVATLDTNRWPLFRALGTRYASFTNLTCEPPYAHAFQVSPNEGSYFFYVDEFRPDPAYPNGIYRVGAGDLDLQSLTPPEWGPDFEPVDLTVSPDGSRWAAWAWSSDADVPGGLIVGRSDGTGVQELDANPYYFHFAEGGQDLIGIYGDSVTRIPIDGSPEQTLFTTTGNFDVTDDSDYGIWSPHEAFSPDNRYLAFPEWSWDTGEGNVRLLDLRTAAATVVQTFDPDSENTFPTLSWAPDSSRFAVMHPDSSRVLIFSTSGELLKTFAIPLDPVSAIPAYQDRDSFPTGPVTTYQIFQPAWNETGTEIAFRVWYIQGNVGYGSLMRADLVTGELETAARLGTTGGGASYHVSTWDGSAWVERGVLHYGMHFGEQGVDLSQHLPDPDGEHKVRIRQTGLEAAHVEAAYLYARTLRLKPEAARLTGSGEDVLARVAKADHELLDLHEKEVELRWNRVPPEQRLYLSLIAREEDLSGRQARPFTYPADGDGSYGVLLGSGGPLQVDGAQTGQDGLGEPLFVQLSRPDTGHPSAEVAGWAASDGAHLYAALDFTVDNTLDGERDWAEVQVETAAGWKAFRVTASDPRWGSAGFGRTGRVSWPHKYYEFKVPLSEIGAAPGATVNVRFAAYGTAAILDEPELLPLYGDYLLWIPRDHALLFAAWFGPPAWMLNVDEAYRQTRVFEDWESFYNPFFTPSGRELIFEDWRDGADPDKGCHPNDWDDQYRFRSLYNLTAEMRARRTPGQGGVRLEGIAADLHFQRYTLEYTSSSAPQDWRPLAPPSSEPVLDGLLGVWVPPGPGSYLVRLTVEDRAGNTRSAVRRVAFSDTPALTDLWTSPAYISPNGDGVKDEMTLHYRVLEPVHLEIQFFGPGDRLVRTIQRDHSQIGTEHEVRWDGRDDRGLPVPDGEYRIVIQSFEFFVTVDTRPPRVSIQAFMRSECPPGAQKQVFPVLTYLVQEENPGEEALETGEGAAPARWTPFAAFPLPDGSIPISLSQFVSDRFRIEATDLAGNRATASTPLADESLFLRGFGPHRLDASGKLVPLVPICPGSSFSFEKRTMRLAFTETVRAEVAGLSIQFQPLPEGASGPREDGWFDAPVQALGSDPDGPIEVLWGLDGVVPGVLIAARVRLVDAGGGVHLSPVFTFVLEGIDLGPLVSPNLLAQLAETDPAVAASLAALLAEHGLVAGLDIVLWGRELLSAPLQSLEILATSPKDPRYAVTRSIPVLDIAPNGVFIALTDWVGCTDYSARAVAVTAPVPDPETGIAEPPRTAEAGREYSIPCLGLAAKWKPIPVGECNGARVSTRRTLTLTPVSRDGKALQILTLSAPGEGVLFNVNKPGSGSSYDFEIDMAGRPEGKVFLTAQLTNVDGEAATVQVPFFVDHTPPVLAITYPQDGQRLCGVRRDGLNLVDVLARVDDGSGVATRLTALGVTQPQFNEHLAPPLSGGILSVSNGTAVESFYGASLPPTVIRTDHQFSKVAPRLTGALVETTGEFTARLEAVDNGGFYRCTETTFYFDGSIEGLNVEATPRIFSPNGDGELDEAVIAVAAEEPTTVDVDVFPAVFDPDQPTRCRTDGDALGRLASGVEMLEGTTLPWDGLAADGTPLPDGRYLVVGTFRDGCGNQQQGAVCVEIDKTPPQVAIAYPRTGDPLPLIVETVGTATDLHFLGWRLEYGAGTDPQTWARLGGDHLARSAEYLASWNTYGLSGDYTLRLVADDAVGNEAEVRVPLVVTTPATLITDLEVTPRPFSPNGDGRRETAAVRFGLGAEVRVDLAVTTLSGTLVRTLASDTLLPAGAEVRNWDGLTNGGQPAPDAMYKVVLEARLASNPLFTQREEITAVLDRTPPAAAVTRPPDYVTPSGPITGSVSDLRLLEYSVQLTDAPSAPAWIEVSHGTTNVVDGFFGSLAGLDEGDWALRIQAEDRAEIRTELIVPFVIDATPPVVTLAAPETGAVLGAVGGPVPVLGAVEEEHLAVWRLEFGAGDAPQSWSVLASGTELPLAAPVHAWNLAGVADGLYTLRLYAEDKAGQVREASARVTVDNTPPTVAIAVPADNGYVTGPLAVTGTASDANLLEYRLAVAPAGSAAFSDLGGGTSSVASGELFQWLALPPDGPHVLRLSAADKAGNAAETTVRVKVDVLPPAAPLALEATLENVRDARLTWTANTEPDLHGYFVYRDGTRLNAQPLPAPGYVDRGLSEGPSTYTVRAVDEAGQEGPASNPAQVRVDLTAPLALIQQPAVNSRVAGLVEVVGTAFSQQDFKEYRLLVGAGDGSGGWQLLRRSPTPLQSDLLGSWNTTALPEGAVYTLRLEAEDLYGNVGAAQAAVTVDNLPPAAPTGLAATASGANAAVTWNANTEADLRGYLLYRDGKLANGGSEVVTDLAPYILASPGFNDASLPDGTFTYVVYAIDRAGNLSDPSAPATLTLDNRAPQAVIVRPEDGSSFEGTLFIQATTPDTDVAQVRFQLKAVADPAWTDAGTDTAAPWQVDWTPGSLPYGDYDLRAVATDQGARTDPAPASITVTYADLTAPPAVTALTARVDGGDVTLTWNPVAEPGLAGYHVDRADESGAVARLTTDPITAATYLDSGLPDATWTYRVVAVDAAGNESDPAEDEAVVYTPAVEQPYTPTADASVSLAGTGAAGSEVVGQAARPSGTAALPPATADAEGRFTLAGLALETGVNTFTLRLRDAEGNLSKTASVRVLRDAAPSAPTGLAAVNPEATRVDLTWNANPEADILGYRPFREGEPALADAPVADFTGATASSQEWIFGPERAIDGDPSSGWLLEPTIAPDEWIEVAWPEPRLVAEVRVLWYGIDGNVDGASDYDIEGWDGQAWVPLARVRNNNLVENVVSLTRAYRTDRLRLTVRANPDWVELLELGVSVQPYVTGTTFSDNPPDGRYEYTVTAVDVYGFESAPSAPAETDAGDVEPPAPVVLTGSVDGSRAILGWTASVSPDVDRYDLYRDGERVASVDGLSYEEVLPNGTYRYQVRPVDGAGNAGEPSNVVELTIAVAPPPAPVLAVTSVPAGGALDLAWTPGAGAAAHSWRVQRSAIAGGPYQAIATVPAAVTTYRDTGLTNGQRYYYVVAALDAAGNSAPSNEASGVPADDVGPGVPFLYHPALPGLPFTTEQPEVTVIGAAEPGIEVALLHDGEEVATATALAADAPASIFAYSPYETPQPSPDGRYLWIPETYYSHAYYDFDTDARTPAPPVRDRVRWFADSRSVVFSEEFYGTIRSYRLADGEVRDLADIDSVRAAFPAPDGQRLAVVGTRSGQGGLWLLDLGSGSWTLLLNASPSTIHTGAVRWSPDGSALAVRRTSPAVVLVVPATGGAPVQVESQAGNSAPDWSRDGSELLVTSLAGGTEQVWRVRADGSGRQALTAAPGAHRSPQWSPDGTEVAWIVNGQGVFVQPADGGQARQVYAGSSGELEWTATGYLFLSGSNSVRIALAGRVTFPGVDLEDGDNTFTAVARDGAGNESAPSPSVVITRIANRPDLSVAAAEVIILPQVLVSGGSARATAVVRNLGVSTSPAAELSFVVLTPDGPSVTVAEHVAVGALAPGASQIVSADFTLSGVTGRYTLVAAVDPAGAVDESDETNNLASRELTVVSEAAPALFAATDRPVYAVGEDVQITLEAVNGGPAFTGRLELAIEDAAGFLVEDLPGFDVTVAGGGSLTREAAWSPVDVLAGAYRVHARLVNGQGNTVAEATAAFTLGGSAQVTAELSADRATYVIGATARLTGGVAYRAGNETLTGVEALIQVLPEAGAPPETPVAEFTRSLGDLLPGAGGTVTADWATTGAAAGPYRGRIEVRQGERILATAETRFDLAAQAPRVTGTLTLSSRTPAWGGPVTASLSVRLTGGTALSQVPVRVVVLDPVENEVLATEPFQLDLPASGAAVQRTASFDTRVLGLGGRLAVLEADLSGQTVTLDVESLTVLDLTPPAVTVDQPQANATVEPDVEVLVTARDGLSPLGPVDVSVDGGGWLRMSVRDAANGRFVRALAGLAEGEHRLKARAADAWGNVAETAEITFTVVVTGAPVLSALKTDALAVDADNDGSPSPGDTIGYTVVVRNTGNAPATGVAVVDPVPAHTAVVPGSVTTTAGTVESQDPPRVAVGELAAGAEATITFRVTVASPLPAGVSQVVNQATVTSAELPAVFSDDPDLGGAADPTATAITASPRLVAEKTDALSIDADGDGQPSPGDTIEYTVVVRNTGNSGATGVALDDPLPAHTTLVSGSNQATLGNLAGGTNATVTFRVRIDSAVPAGVHQISNQGTVTSNELPAVLTDDPDAAGAADPTVTPITAAPRLTVTKTDVLFADADSDGTASPGDALLYQVAVANGGNTSATDVELSDAVPAHTAIEAGSVQVSQGSVVNEDPVQAELGEITAGATATVSFRVRIDSPVPAGVREVSNQATVTSAELPAILSDDPDAGGDADPTVTPIAAAPRLTAEKTDALAIDANADGVPSPGDTIEYTVVVRNTGNTPATAVEVLDPIPARTTVVAGSASTTLGTIESESPLRVAVGELAAAGQATAVFRVRIDAVVPAGVRQVSNQATLTSAELPAVLSDDPDAGGTADPTVTALNAAPRLVAEKTDLLAVDADASGSPSPGDTLEYSVTLRNLGNTGATGVVFTDPIPAHTVLVAGSVMTSAGTVESESPVEVSVGTIDAGATVSVSFRVTVNKPIATGVRQVSNQGSVASAELPAVLTDDPDVAGNADPTVTPITAAPFLSVTKTAVLFDDADGNGTASPNDVLLYQIAITSSGNTSATGVALLDPIPAFTTVVAGSVQSSQGAIVTESPVLVQVGELAAGATATVSFRVRILPLLPASVLQVSNQATVTCSELPAVLSDDPAAGGTADPTVTPIQSEPALSAEKTDTLAVDADGDGSPSPGDTIEYTVTVRNTGSGPATDVAVVDPVPAHTSMVAGSVTTTAGTIESQDPPRVAVGELAAGTDATITLRVTVASPLPAGVSQAVNQATVTSAELPAVLSDDPDLGGAADPTATAITASPRLVAEKTDALAVDADNDGSPSPGDTIEYTVVVRNTGNSEATGVALDDPLPAHTSLVSGSNQAALGNLAGGATADVTFRVRINAAVPAGVYQVSNQGTVTSNELPAVLTDDPDAAGAADPTVTPITAAPRLTVTKTDVLFEDADSDGTASPGDALLYQVAIANGGNTSATGVELSDAIPAHTQIEAGSLQASQGTVVSESPVRAELGEITAGASATVSFRVRIDSPVPAGVLAVSNQASVTSSELPAVLSDDPDAGGDADPTVTPIAAAPRLAAEKTDALAIDADGDGSPSPGDTLEYTIALRNTGNTPATGILVLDPAPARMAIVAGSASTTLGTVESESPLRVSLAELAAGGEATVVFRARIDATVPAGVLEVSNQATVTSNELPALLSDDPEAGGAADATVTAITAAPLLVAEKTDLLAVDADGDGAPSPGDTIEYSVTLRNLGNTGATGVAFADGIPAHTALVAGSVMTSAGTVGSESPVQVSVGTLDAGATVAVSFRVTVNNPITAAVRTVVNQGTVASAELPAVLTDDPDVAGPADPTVTSVTAAPRLAATKTDLLFEDVDGDGAASPGDALLYQIAVTNSGNTAATGLLLDDAIPAHTAVILDTAQSSQGTVLNESPVVVDLGDLAAGATASVSFRVRIDSQIPPEVLAVSNQATVTNVELPPVASDDPETAQAGDATATPIVITPAISIGGATLEESAGAAELAVTLSIPSNQEIRVAFATADGTAAAGVDYTSATGTLAFAPGETAKTVTVAVLDDTLDEDDETFKVTLSGVQGAAVLAVAEGLGTIRDDDDPPVLVIGDLAVLEGNGAALVPVTLSTASSRDVRVSWATAAGTAQAGTDYVQSSGTVILPAGSLAGTIAVEVLPDLLDEADETFRVVLSSPVAATVLDGEALVTITDDDPLPSLSVADVTVTEGTGAPSSAVFTLTLSPASGREVSVSHATAAGTAQAQTDFLPASGVLTFPAGTTVLTVTVPVVADAAPEGNETFALVLSQPLNAGLADAEATATVVDDDAMPVLSISGTDVEEGDSGTVSATLTLTLSAASGSAVTVQYATEDGTATAGDDYVSAAGTATIPAGSLSTSVTVQVHGDEEKEADETVLVRLSDPANATLGTSEGTVTILDDDLPHISVLDLRVSEGNAGTANALVTVELDGPSAGEVRVAYSTEDGTAAAGRDYQAVSGTLTFAPGQTTATLAVPVIGDVLLEALEETFAVVLSAPVGGEIERARAEVVIEDDEACASPNLLSNPGAEELPRANDPIPGWAETEGTGWRRKTSNPAPAEGAAYFFAGSVQHAELAQDVNVSGYAAHILTGDQDFELQASVRTFSEAPSDAARVVLEFRDQANLVVLDAWDSGEVASPGAWQRLTHRRTAPADTGWIRVRLISTRFNGGADGANDGYFDAVSLRSLRAATLSIGDALAYEGPVGTTTNAVFPVTLSCPVESAVSVRYATADGTALAGSDYLASQGVLTFPSGEVSRAVTVPVLGDEEHELHESFTVNLTEPAPLPDVVLADPRATGAIVNDDFCPRSPGFWKTHTEVWPVSSLALGNVQYDAAQLLALLSYKGSNTSHHLARQLVATKLNLLVGSPVFIVPTVNEADLFLAAYPPGSNPPSAQKQRGEVLKNQLDAYNNMGCQEDPVIP